MAIVTDKSTNELKKRLKAALYGTDQTVQTCARVDDPTRSSWGSFYASAMDYVNEGSSFWQAASDMDRGEAYEVELYEWQKKLEGLGCQLTTVKHDPKESAKATADLIKWAGIAIVAVSTAYVAGKVVDVVNIAKK